jgi:RNA-binding protein YlmH
VIDFCRPPEVAAIERTLGTLADLNVKADGGYPQAERKRVFFSRAVEYAEDEAPDAAGSIQAINVEGELNDTH